MKKLLKVVCTIIVTIIVAVALIWQDSGKPIAGTSILMRLILDRCATVNEALDLIASLDVRHDQKVGGGYHYLVADAQGNCAAIEFDLFDGWKTMITNKPDSVCRTFTGKILSGTTVLLKTLNGAISMTNRG